MQHLTAIVSLSAFLMYMYVLDPFTDKPRNRRYKKLFTLNRSSIAIVICISILQAIGIGRIFYGDHITIAFTSIPLMLIILIWAANLISLRFYERKFTFLLRGDYLGNKFTSDVVFSIFVLCMPIVLSIYYILKV